LLTGTSALAVTISGFSPSSGQPGNVVIISGTGFTGITNVAFNNAAPTLAAFQVVSSAELLTVVPLGATSGPLTVNGTPSSASFSVAPVITGFSPQTGSPPTVVYINGANFVTNQTMVKFPGAAAVSGTVTASTVVGAAVPAGASTGPITVTTPAGSATTTSNFIDSTVPTITSFNPTVGPTNTLVTIFGGNFFGTPTVKFNGIAAAVTVVSTTELMVTSPYGATTGPISVSTSDGSFTTSSNFITGAGPIVTSFAPTIGTTYTVVTNYGYNLSTATNVTINGAKEYISGYSSTYLQVTVTNASGTGPIKVFTPQGTFTTSSNFSSAAGPVIGDFSPTVGGPGIYVVIDGLNFSSVTVKFGGVAATSSIRSATQIIATVPSGASTGPISVTSSAGTFTTSSNFSVTTSAPFIAGLSPGNGVQGTTVTINGANFTNVSSVKFNGVTGTFTTPTSTTILYATVPPDATSGPVTVTSSSGTGTSSSLFYLQPWITNATASGIVNSSLVISGINLTNTTAIVVDGVSYPSFTNSPTQVVATVPANATTGPITLTAPGGIFISTNNFVVLPKIYSFTPTIGPAGTVVTIGGTSLFDVTNVLFDGTATTPFNVMTNQLQAAVPSGARPGPITVVTAGGNDVSTNIFTATYSSTVNLSKTASPTVTGVGSNVVFTLVLTNTGPSTVTSVSLTDNIPNGFIYSSSTTTAGSNSYTNNVLLTTIPVFASNTSAIVTVTGTSAQAGSLTNYGAFGFAEGNTIYGTNSAIAPVYFLSAAQRTLGISESTNGGSFTISWPVSTPGFALQVNTNLSNPAGWVTVTNGIFATNGLNEYTNVAPASSPEFFRLRGP